MGMTASFLPMPVVGVNGTDVHAKVSIMKKGKILFWDSSPPPFDGTADEQQPS